MRAYTRILGAAQAAALISSAVTGCGDASGPDDTSRVVESPPEDIGSIQRNLERGDRGDDVRALHDYLTRYGYFPSDALRENHPGMKPVVDEGPADRDIFDEHTERAVRAYQALSGLEGSGVVDAATRADMLKPRCGFPDGAMREHGGEKFAFQGFPFTKSNITFQVQANPFNVCNGSVQLAATNGANTWAAQTSLTIGATAGTPDIPIECGWIDDAGGNLAATGFPTLKITVDVAENWSTAWITPANAYDLYTAVLHEFGHALGIAHSSLPTSVMYKNIAKGTQRRILTPEDAVPISALYDTWQTVPGQAIDIAVAANADVWSLSTVCAFGGCQPQKWNGFSWVASDGVATRIAVEPNGTPWAIGPTGGVYRRTVNSPTSGVWELKPGCAKDIAIGGNGDVWILGCESVSGGFSIKKWNGAAWVTIENGGARIAVGPTGIPVVIKANGDIQRRMSSNAGITSTWEALPPLGTVPTLQTDIYVDQFGYTLLVGADNRVYVLAQNQADPLDWFTPGLNVWRDMHSDSVRAVAGGPLGFGANTGAWAVRASDNAILRNVR